MNMGTLGIPPCDTVLMNPPFRYAESHVRQAVARLKPGGRLVALLPDGLCFGTRRGMRLYPWLSAMGTIRAVIGVSGADYRKYGAAYDCAVLVFDRAKHGEASAPLTGRAEKFKDLPALLEQVKERVRYEDLLENHGQVPSTMLFSKANSGHERVVAQRDEAASLHPYVPLDLGGTEHPSPLVQSAGLSATKPPELIYRAAFMFDARGHQ
jgi:hypothetical protein